MTVSRKIILFFLPLFLLFFTACSLASAESAYFSKSDYNNVAQEAADATITLDGDRGTLSDETRGQSGNPVVIERKGVYRVTGSSDGVTILIREPKKSGNIYLVLDGVSMRNEIGPCIESQAAEKTIIQCVGENRLVSGADTGSPLYAADDLTINGPGRLTVESAKNGVQCKGALRITGAKLSIQAENDALKGKKGFYLDGGSVTVTKCYEGVEGREVVICSGELRVTASDDGLNAAGDNGRQGDIRIEGGTVYINAAGDALDSNRSICIEGGTTLVEGPANSRNSIFDKGDTADSVLSISGGTVIAIGSAEKAKNFSDGTQYARLELLSGHAGDVISADDGSRVSLTATRDFECVIYSSPSFTARSRIQVYSASGATGGELSVKAENVYMQLAIREALDAIAKEHSGPFGCVIVKDGQIAGQGHDQVLLNSDPTCHAEIAAIRDAAERLGTADLSGCELYTTAEPCTMCLSACLWAKIDRVFFGCTLADRARLGFPDAESGKLSADREGLDGYLLCTDREACLALFDNYRKSS